MKKKLPLKKVPVKSKDSVIRQSETFLTGFLIFSFLILLTLIYIVFGPCLSNGFCNWDDPTYIENNPLIKEFNTENIKRIFTEIYFSNYQPLHIFSYLIEYQFFELNPFGYHLVSLVMHAMVSVAVMWFVYLLSKNYQVTIISGILFAIHPMHVESVAWAAERKDLLYSLFFFLSLIAYLYYLKDTGKKLNLIFCFLIFILSIFSKAMAASLPPILVLTDLYYKRTFTIKTILEKVPFFLLALTMGLISVYASGKDGSINTNETFNFVERIFLANSNLLLYIIKLIVPFHLSPFYPYPDKINDALPIIYYLSPIGVIALTGITWYAFKKNRIVFFSITFFVLTVFLVLQLLPVGPTVFSERYSYIPSATLFMLTGYGVVYLIERAGNKFLYRFFIYTTFLFYSFWLTAVTYNRCKIWKDPEVFWSDVILKFENVPIAYNNRGHYYNKSGKKKEALADFNKAISLNSNYDLARFNRGSLFGETGKFNEALEDLNIAINVNKKLPEAYKMRGQVYAITGKKKEALSDFQTALKLQPEFPEIHYNLGIFYLNDGNSTEACKNFLKAKEQHFEKAIDAVEKYCKK